MNIWEVDKLFIFIAFVIPGFIAIKAFELFFPAQVIQSSKQIVDAITYSCINYALLLLPIYWVETNHLFQYHPFIYIAFYVSVLFIAPLLWAYIWKNLRESGIFQKNAPHPTQKPWDYVFAQRKSYWVIVNLKDGTKIAGKYCEKSFSSSSPSYEQIYLEESWELNNKGGFERKHNQTSGVIVVTSEINYVELFDAS